MTTIRFTQTNGKTDGQHKNSKPPQTQFACGVGDITTSRYTIEKLVLFSNKHVQVTTPKVIFFR